MTKLALVAFILIISAVPAIAQNSAPYTIDNFDFANGVRIETPRVQPIKRGARRSRLNVSGASNQAPLIDNNTLAVLKDGNASAALIGFTTGNSAIDGFIVASGKRNAVDPLLLYSIMHQESTFKRNALSPKGASGLMQ